MLAPRKKLHVTPPEVVDQALELLEVKKTDLLLDIGCGDGRSLIHAAKAFGCKALGIEIEHERAAAARATILAEGLEDLITIHEGNAMEFDGFYDATAVFLFLTDRGLRLVLPMLRAIPRPIRIATYLYKFKGIKPTKRHLSTQKDKPLTGYPIYLYHFQPPSRLQRNLQAQLEALQEQNRHLKKQLAAAR